MGNNFVVFFLGNGRKGYLERTIASWQANLKDRPQNQIIFDDSGNSQYFNSLKKKYGDDFDVIEITNNEMGHAGAMSFIFDYLKQTEADYFVQVEEDWMLFRELSVIEIIKVLDQNKHIAQMRLPRAVWYNPEYYKDIESGSLLKNHLDLPEAEWLQKDKWFEWRGPRYFWTHNPSVFHKSILYNKYPQIKVHGQHENEFGKILLEQSPKLYSGFWARNIYDAYVLHIGFYDEKLKQRLNSINIDYKFDEKFGGK